MLRNKRQTTTRRAWNSATQLAAKLKFRRSPIRRRGFSLMEVMIAMAICVLGLAMILQITSLSQAFSQKAMDATELQVIAQNRINEVLASIQPPEEVLEEVCPENEQVFYTLSLRQHPALPLANIEVTVWFENDPAKFKLANSKGAHPTRNQAARRDRSREFQLSRWVHTGQSPIPADSNEAQREGVTQ